VQYAKTHLSTLLAAVERGEEFVIARGDHPAARPVPVEARESRELGCVAYPSVKSEPPAVERAATTSAAQDNSIVL